METMLKNNQPLIKTENLSIGFNQKTIHQNLNLQMKSGEFICILGHNGAGKTTLLKTITGLIKPIQGIVYLNNQPLHSYSNRQISKLISIVLTEKSLTQDMTVRELVATGRMPYTGFFGRLSKNDWSSVNQSLETLNIAHLQNMQLHAISDGERQKAMIAKALSQETPIILLDEPTAFLDLAGKVELLAYLQKLAHQTNKCIAISTHDVEQALQFADTLWLVSHNKPLCVGMPEDLILSKQFAQFFENATLQFDQESGHFRTLKTPQGNVEIEGIGLEQQWLERALKRYGFQVKDNSTTKISIHKNGHTEYRLTTASGHKQVMEDIEDVLHTIRNLQ